MAKTPRATLQASATDARNNKGGGWRGSPASLAALARHRVTWADAPHCRCGLVALSGRATCYRHGGARNPSPARLASRELDRRWPLAKCPDELRRLDTFQRLRFGPLRLQPLTLELCDAWAVKAEDPARWVRIVRAARAALEG